jgi:hypothetical protein
MRRTSRSRLAVFICTAVLATLLAPSAAAQSCGASSGRYRVRVQPGLLAFPSPTLDDFAVGWIEHGPVQLDIQPLGSSNRPWVVCLRADGAEMGGGKPISDLEYRSDTQATWTALSTGDQLLAEGIKTGRVTLQFRIRLDETTDQAGTYRADYTVTASRQ